MLTELYIFFVRQIPPSLKSVTSSCDKILLLQKRLHREGLCVQQTGTAGADHWTEAERVDVFVFNSRVPTRQLWNSQPVLRHPPLFSVQLVKQSKGVVCYLAVTTTLSVFVSPKLKWNSKVSGGKSFYPDSATLVQNCQHLGFHCKDSRHTAFQNSQTEHKHEAENTH